MKKGPQVNYQRLGYKTFVLFVLERTRLFLFFLFIAILTFLIKIFIAENISSFLNETLLPLFKSNVTINIASIFFWLSLSSFIASILSLLSAIFTGYLEYTNFRFAIDDDAFRVKQGILNKEEISIPYQKIQDVNIRQTVFYRILGLTMLIVLTAGHEDEHIQKLGAESEGILPGIDHQLAAKIQEEILKRTSINKVFIEKLRNKKILMQ